MEKNVSKYIISNCDNVTKYRYSILFGKCVKCKTICTTCMQSKQDLSLTPVDNKK